MSRYSHAIVIGGSVAGLMAARVLSTHFEKVTLLERDEFPTHVDARNGVPQARQGHILLSRGFQIWERYFPGISDAIRADGGEDIDWGLDYTGLTGAGWTKTGIAGRSKTLAASRILLEYHVRTRVRALPNVEIIERVDVTCLIPNAARTAVEGVVLTSRADHSECNLTADLVVDCSGRNSKIMEWYAALGYQTPKETHINSFVGYATRWYEAPANARWKFIGILGNPQKMELRGGGILSIEGNKWTVTLQGLNKDYPPTDEEGFMAFAKSLASPAVYDLMRSAKPISPIYGFRYAGSRRRHFEKLARVPERLVVLGDAICSFNPIYGQGMTVASIEAEALDELVAKSSGLDRLAKRYFATIHRLTEDAWTLATGEDMRYPGTEGDKPTRMQRLSQRYTDMVVNTLPYDAEVTATFIEVIQLVRRPTALIQPGILLRVLRHNLFGHRSQAAYRMPELHLQNAGAD